MTLNLPLTGEPCGKVRHYDPAEAEDHRAALERWEQAHGEARPGRELVTYWCDACSAFHVGHKAGRKTGGK
jgi:hypothetical protein